MTGYRRVLTCGEPCAEDFECRDCVVENGLSTGTFCSTITGDTACPSTLSVAVTAPAITLKIDCGDDCQTYIDLPAVDVTVAVTQTTAQNCIYEGTSAVGTATVYPCSPASSYSEDYAIDVQIAANYLTVFTDHQPFVLSPCSSAYCEGYVIGVFYYGTSPTTEMYGFATSFRGNTAGSCSGSTRCYNEYSTNQSAVVSSWVDCGTGGDCCGTDYKAASQMNPTNCASAGPPSCSLPTGFSIGAPT